MDPEVFLGKNILEMEYRYIELYYAQVLVLNKYQTQNRSQRSLPGHAWDKNLGTNDNIAKV